MLRVSFIGNLGADPEARYTAKGTLAVSLRCAVNQVRTSPDGERVESTEWFRVRVSGRQAEYAQRLTKGSRVLVFGNLDISHYTDKKTNEPRTGFDVWADDVQSFSRRDDQEPATAGAPKATNNVERIADNEDLENLPF